MKLALILLCAVAAFAGHDDDWRKPPHHAPGSPVPEPATFVMLAAGLAIGVAAKMRKK